jgi:hypothetical protein
MTFDEPLPTWHLWQELADEARAALARGEQLDRLQFLALERLKPQAIRFGREPRRWREDAP